jgi:hypothetical protein
MELMKARGRRRDARAAKASAVAATVALLSGEVARLRQYQRHHFAPGRAAAGVRRRKNASPRRRIPALDESGLPDSKPRRGWGWERERRAARRDQPSERSRHNGPWRALMPSTHGWHGDRDPPMTPDQFTEFVRQKRRSGPTSAARARKRITPVMGGASTARALAAFQQKAGGGLTSRASVSNAGGAHCGASFSVEPATPELAGWRLGRRGLRTGRPDTSARILGSSSPPDRQQFIENRRGNGIPGRGSRGQATPDGHTSADLGSLAVNRHHKSPFDLL